MVIVGVLGAACGGTATPEASASFEADSEVSPAPTIDRPPTEEESDTSAPAPDGGGNLIVERGIPLGQIQDDLEPGEVKLWVSNQSFGDDPVGLTISVDGTQIVLEQFHVEGQHNWIAFDLRGLKPGPHVLVASSDTGIEHVETFTVMEDEPRWLVLDYWHELDDQKGRHFTFAEFDHPVAFA